ncbi:MAG: hypothetical protein WC260_03050 [Candidatus Pacearchaeota archaeon]
MKKRCNLDLVYISLFKLSLICVTIFLVGLLIYNFPRLIFSLTKYFWIFLFLAIIFGIYPLYRNLLNKPTKK